jgi:hypothetical protein
MIPAVFILNFPASGDSISENKQFHAKAQRRKEEARKEQAALNSLACLLCATSAFARDCRVEAFCGTQHSHKPVIQSRGEHSKAYVFRHAEHRVYAA